MIRAKTFHKKSGLVYDKIVQGKLNFPRNTLLAYTLNKYSLFLNFFIQYLISINTSKLTERFSINQYEVKKGCFVTKKKKDKY